MSWPVAIMRGEVVRGKGRGSSQLDIPTANMVPSLNLNKGIYFGLARIESNPQQIYKAVSSLGYNPFFGDSTTMVLETHLIDYYDQSKLFYGQILEVILLGYLRPELNFESLQQLKEAMKADIAEAVVNIDKFVDKENELVQVFNEFMEKNEFTK